MTTWLLNSAVLPAGEYGTYRFSAATWDDLRRAIHAACPVGEPSIDNDACPRRGWTASEILTAGISECEAATTTVVSRIGYPETAALICRQTGWNPPLSREASAMAPGDVAYIVRLRYRVADPATKGRATGAPDDAWEVARLNRLVDDDYHCETCANSLGEHCRAWA